MLAGVLEFHSWCAPAFVRGDYKELVQLVLLYLNDDDGLNFTKFERAGALHKARWMAKMLYAIKMELLSFKNYQKGLFLVLANRERLVGLFSSLCFVMCHGG